MIKSSVSSYILCSSRKVIYKARTAQAGFTLMELMVTFAIIAILSTIAFPAYTDYVKQGKVAEATSTLADLRIRTEQYFQDNRTYVDAPCLPAVGTTKYFTYACDTTATTFTITATGMSNHDLSGFEYTIDQNNNKTSKYESAVGLSCWITKKNGSC